MKRYTVLRFPSLNGSPRYTDSRLSAVLMALFSLAPESRVIDNQTGRHIFVN